MDTCANSVAPDETAHNEPSHQELHCLLFASMNMSKFKSERAYIRKFRDEIVKFLKKKPCLWHDTASIFVLPVIPVSYILVQNLSRIKKCMYSCKNVRDGWVYLNAEWFYSVCSVPEKYELKGWHIWRLNSWLCKRKSYVFFRQAYGLT